MPHEKLFQNAAALIRAAIIDQMIS